MRMVLGPLLGLGLRLLRGVAILLAVCVLLFAVLPDGGAGSWLARCLGWVGGVLGGDLGRSAWLERPVSGVLGAALPATVELVLVGMVAAGGLGIGGGLVLFALRGEREGVGSTAAVLLGAVPGFVWALLLSLGLGVWLGVLPVSGRLDGGLGWPVFSGFLLLDTLVAGDLWGFASGLRHMVVPGLALGLAFAPAVMLRLRAALVAADGAAHIRQLRRQGVAGGDVLLEHALPGAAGAVLGRLGGGLGGLLGAAVLVEAVLAYPGMGGLLVEALRQGDAAVVRGVGLGCCAVVLLAPAAERWGVGR